MRSRIYTYNRHCSTATRLFFALFLYCSLYAQDKTDEIDVTGWMNDPNAIVFVEPAHEFESFIEVENRTYLKWHFAAIVFIAPEKQGSCSEKIEILHVIKDSLNFYKKGDKISVDECDKDHFYKPIYMLADFESGKIKIKSLLDMEDYIFTPTAVYHLDRENSGSPLPMRFDFLLPHRFSSSDILRFHALYTPYFNPSKTYWFYADTLVQRVNRFLSYMGKNENDKKSFFQRLAKNREPVKATPVNAEFAALGTIRGMKEVGSGNNSY